ADPAADWPASALALDAEIVAQGTSKRVIKATKFFKGPFETALKPTELILETRIPVPKGAKVGQAYIKFERKAGDYAIVGVASLVVLNEEGEFEKVGLGLTAVNPFPFVATDAQELLLGQKPTKDLIEQAAKAASAMSDPSSDLRGSAAYKREMAKVFTRRSLYKALERAGVAI
ncbi:MAG: FAD binding domain-containing protein, partial [Candidatus Caldarchaeum sp.]|nr:FAD binding domain-containing protein [Candidatus Caldarchaeum sp.]